MAEMSARRSTRERKRPKQIYKVLDTRDDVEGLESVDGIAGTRTSDQEGDGDEISEEEESSDDEEEEADAREFSSSMAKPRAKSAGASVSRGGAAAKRKPLVRPRKLKPVQEGKQRKGNGEGNEDGDEDTEEDNGDDVFFGTSLLRWVFHVLRWNALINSSWRHCDAQRRPKEEMLRFETCSLSGETAMTKMLKKQHERF